MQSPSVCGSQPLTPLMQVATSVDSRWAQSSVLMHCPVWLMKHWSHPASFAHATLALAVDTVAVGVGALGVGVFVAGGDVGVDVAAGAAAPP